MLPLGTNIELKRLPKATLVLIVLNVLVFSLEAFLEPGGRRWLFDLFRFSAVTKNPLSPITYTFLHGNLFHIVGNMLFLWIFGGPVEERIGVKKYVYYYFGAGLWSVALWAVMHQLGHPGSPQGIIGASGAVSGVIALYLYRCYYSKLKMVLDPIFLPFKFNIPAAPLIIFWFAKDLLQGIGSVGETTGVAYWGHVGGFLFGFAVARINRYGHEGQLEHTKDKLLAKLRESDGWKTSNAEKELLQLIKLSPQDPEIPYQLAQFYAAHDRRKEAEEHFQLAIQRYLSTNSLLGASTVLELYQYRGKPLSLHYHLKAAELFIEQGWTDDAFKVLAPVATAGVSADALTERAMALFIKACLALEKKDEAAEAYGVFSAKFPKSRQLPVLTKAFTLHPNDIFPVRAEEPAKPAVAESGKTSEKIDAGFEVAAVAVKIVSDPLFFFLWIVLMSILSFLGKNSWQTQISMFTLAFFITAFYRVEWLDIFSTYNRPSEEKARQEVDISLCLSRAQLAERGEAFPKAAELYEQLLAMDAKNIQARFNLARIYHHRLQDRDNARKHYTLLKEHAPKDHPFHGEAERGLQESAFSSAG